MLVEITYPVVLFNVIRLQMTEEDLEHFKGLPQQERAELICRLNDERALPDITFRSLIEQALEIDCAHIKPAAKTTTDTGRPVLLRPAASSVLKPWDNTPFMRHYDTC
ncbi:hypothetical protein [Arsenicibacter rosenii]|uniref:Uncharacterized protein n=1 Tax=Arsenicibacter rosenii TaxID=1750698 RepID=A0A1S2VNI8_9BACT|nr:hypothetical protein [Arsenicibacter rosenii]OIN59775.1 hypothetical protein BLX24_07925 [Arsenicibacter rosenii]